MARKDLKNEYDGWQVIDATPQEISDGNMLKHDFGINVGSYLIVDCVIVKLWLDNNVTVQCNC